MTFYFEKLIVWQKSLALTKIVYKIIKTLPKEEQYSLIDQMRRASISIMSNIAEWSGRSSNADKNHFFVMAKWSSMELASQFILMRELGYIISEEEYVESLRLIEDISSMLFSLSTK